MIHSGDNISGRDFLAYVKINADIFTNAELGVFISGFNYTPITQFLGTYPALLVADHVDMVSYKIALTPASFG